MIKNPNPYTDNQAALEKWIEIFKAALRGDEIELSGFNIWLAYADALRSNELTNEYSLQKFNKLRRDKIMRDLEKNWSYDEAVNRTKPKVDNLRRASLEIVQELFVAQKKLGNSGYRRDLNEGNLVPNDTRLAPKTFGEFLEDIGIPRRTAYRWLALYNPDQNILLTEKEFTELSKEKQIKRDEWLKEKVNIFLVTGVKGDDWDADCEFELKLHNDRERRIKLAQGADWIPDNLKPQASSVINIFDAIHSITNNKDPQYEAQGVLFDVYERNRKFIIEDTAAPLLVASIYSLEELIHNTKDRPSVQKEAITKYKAKLKELEKFIENNEAEEALKKLGQKELLN